jgi:16S rRNA (cytidine1402-2'-O)-methyltransferase
VLVSTPIGNLGDMTLRGLEFLRRADLVLCEDTRMTARLLTHYGITTHTAPLHEHNESARIPELLDRLRRGERLALGLRPRLSSGPGGDC